MKAEEARKLSESNLEERKQREERWFKEAVGELCSQIKNQAENGYFEINRYAIKEIYATELQKLGYKVELNGDYHKISW